MQPTMNCLLLASTLFVLMTAVLCDIKLMHPLPGGGMVLRDVSYDTPDHHYIAASPLGGYYAADLGDNFIPAAGLGGLGRGLVGGAVNMLPSAYGGPLIGGGLGGRGLIGSGVVNGYRGYRVSSGRRYGKRVRVIRI